MSKKPKQWNCRAGINGWHKENCPHLKQQSEWEERVEKEFWEDMEKTKQQGDWKKPEVNLIVNIVNNHFLDSDYQGKDWEAVRKSLILELDSFLLKEREETLRSVLPKDLTFDEANELAVEPDDYLFGFKRCKKLIKLNAQERWDIKL